MESPLVIVPPPSSTAPIAQVTPAAPVPAPRRPSPLPRFARQMLWRFEEAERMVALPHASRRLYVDLVALRARLAKDAAIPAFRILTNRQLLKIVEALPTDHEALAGGLLTATKIAAFGAEILALTRLHLAPAPAIAAAPLDA